MDNPPKRFCRTQDFKLQKASLIPFFFSFVFYQENVHNHSKIFCLQLIYTAPSSKIPTTQFVFLSSLNLKTKQKINNKQN